jgi:hypothetical protein
MVFYEINPKILLWVNIILNMLVLYEVRLVNIIYGLVFIIMSMWLGCNFNVLTLNKYFGLWLFGLG